MFTNWLTDATGLTNSRTSARLPETNNHLSAASTKMSNITAGLSLLSGHSLTNLNSNIMSTPPDIALEVGPAPTTVRFMAHGLVLGMHSGYLRSAIRLDERGAGPAVSNGGGVGGSNVADIIIFLTNVTPEQFAPLLSYMYTGYLDLNVENIFGVLLATHVLHMPRALEICRSYLARAQTEGYFGPHNTPSLNTINPNATISPPSGGKIIRPIASKPQLTNFGFLPLSHQSLAHNPITANISITPAPTITVTEPESNNSTEDLNKNEEEDDIEVDEVDKQSVNNENQMPMAAGDEEEDIEVFIDSNSEAEVVVETQMQKLTFKKLMENKKSLSEKDSNRTRHQDKAQQQHRKSSHHHKSERRRKVSSGLQVAKAPIPASQLDCTEANKVIIDVASCDGPVRFKRILNTAYGHKPDACSSTNSHAGLTGTVMPERSLQSVSLSFHQQMAKTISQQQQLHQTEESENSETSNGSIGAPVRAAEKISSGGRKTQSEVFVCVYCKHTFKSQYCYQKHAKRHLNPLTLQATCVPESKTITPEEPSLSSELKITKHQNINLTRPFYARNSTHSQYLTTSSSVSTANSNSITSSNFMRREVRPLDMNVQYYPCKTCGCKFPSYYFVHKHRKMCHAEEEEPQQNIDENNTINSTQTNSGGGGGVATKPAEENLNSICSD